MEEQSRTDLDARVLAMRNAGASWLDIQRELNLTRQRARYAYQRAKREERRDQRKGRVG